MGSVFRHRALAGVIFVGAIAGLTGLAEAASAPATAASGARTSGASSPSTPRAGSSTARAAPKKKPASSATAPRVRARAATPPAKPPLEAAADARSFAELGAYGRAADALRALRRRVPADADLEIALAMYEARSGDIDSAAARLWSPLVERALDDTLPISRRHDYAWKPEALWISGRFDGWSWYPARARAEIAARTGRWPEALEAARRAVAARPLQGKEWLILGLIAARAGDPGTSRAAIARAAALDPSLPEAQYAEGLMEWREGHRPAAQARFRQAIALDSTYRPPGLALMHSRLPGAPPDTLPGELLSGARAAGLLTSRDRPKNEEFEQMDSPALILTQTHPQVPDSLKGEFKNAKLYMAILIDERGRIAATNLPWFDPKLLPDIMVSLAMETLPSWRFQPAMKFGAPHATWSNIELTIEP